MMKSIKYKIWSLYLVGLLISLPYLSMAQHIMVFKHGMNEAMSLMMGSTPRDHQLKDIDHAFASVMIPHHQAAVAMARCVISYAKDNQIVTFSHQLIAVEQIEIGQMSLFNQTYAHEKQ